MPWNRERFSHYPSRYQAGPNQPTSPLRLLPPAKSFEMSSQRGPSYKQALILGLFPTQCSFWEWVCLIVSLQENRLLPDIPALRMGKSQLSSLHAGKQVRKCRDCLCSIWPWAVWFSSISRASCGDILPRKGRDINTSWGLRAQRIHKQCFCMKNLFFLCWNGERNSLY